MEPSLGDLLVAAGIVTEIHRKECRSVAPTDSTTFQVVSFVELRRETAL